MKRSLKVNDQGNSLLVVVIIIVVLAVVGGVGYYVWHKKQTNNNTTTGTNSAISKQELAAACSLTDKNICKFYTAWKNINSYSIQSTSTVNGQQETTNMDYSSPNKYHITISSPAYETITIGDVVYTKASDGTWWKQQPSQQSAQKATSNVNVNFQDPNTNASANTSTSYKLVGQEACGNLTCYKYQYTAPDSSNSTQYIWFDTKDFRLRKISVQSADTNYTATVSYNSVTVNAPANAKDLGANQVLVPGQAQPETIPNYSGQ